jgi:hypothetical protein
MPTLPVGPDDLVEEAIREFPALVGLLREYGVVCIRCGEPVWGTLAELIQSKGLDPDEVLAALNARLRDGAVD